MKKRRDFIQLSVGLLGLPLVSLPGLATIPAIHGSSSGGPMVKQPADRYTAGSGVQAKAHD
jgi:hypothetical protein